MASNKINVLVAPQPSLQPTVTALRPRPHPPNPTAATLVKRTGRTASPIPSWLRPMNRESRPNRRDTTPSASSAVGSGRTTLPNYDRTQTQPHSSAPRHESEPPPVARDIVFTSSPAPKRKAPVVAPRDEEQRDRPLRYVAANLNGRGGAMESRGGGIWIDEDEGERIRMEASMTGREIHSTTKRARRAAVPDDNDEPFLSWKRKTGGVPRTSRNAKSVGVDSMADCSMPARNDASPLEDCDFGFGTGAANECAASGNVSENLPATLDEATTVPLRESMQLDLDRVPERGEHSNDRNAGLALEMSPVLLPHELSPDRLGNLPDLNGTHFLDSIDDASDSDTPLALLLSRSRGTRQLTLSTEGLQSGEKGKARAREDGFDTADVNISREGHPLDVAGRQIATAAPETLTKQSFNGYGKGRGVKAKATASKSGAREYIRTPSTRPRKIPRTECSDTDDGPLGGGPPPQSTVSPVRTLPRAKTTWRVVGPPRRVVHPTGPFPTQDLRPRVWAGGKDELFAALPALAKNHGGVAWENLCPTLIFSEKKCDASLGWWKDDVWEGRRITFSIVREVNIPLYPPVCHSESDMHNSLFDAGCTSVDLRALSEPSPNFPAPTSIHNGESPMVRSSREATASSALPEAGPSRVNLENHAGVPSPFIDAMETHCGMNHSSPCHQPGVRYDYDGDIDIGVRPPSLMACNAADHHHEFIANPRFSTADSDGHVDHCSSAVQLPAEPTRINDPATFGNISSADAGRSAPGAVPSLETRGQLSCSAPESIWKSPKTHISQPDTCRPPSGSIRPYSSELAPANLSFPPYGPVTTSDFPDTATTYATLLSCEGESLRHLPLPQPPPEVTALITTRTSGDVVSPVFSRKSPLVPWELPLEIGYFWLGLFKIFDVKVETHQRRNTSNTVSVQCTWRFYLEWVPGGEDLLLDDEHHDYREWSVRIMRPWWEPENLLRQPQHLSSEISRLLLPLPLLAPFTENSTASGNFPSGYYCTTCGRVNVQRFLRHRVCESATCNAKTDPKREIGWVIGPSSTRDRKANSATVSPDDRWTAPTTAEPAVGFDDGTRLFHYHLATPTLSGSGGSSAPMASDDRSTVDGSSLSVRHIFNSNRAALQAGASALFEALQRDVRIERSIGSTVFSTPLFESGDNPALRCNGRSVWDHQAGIIESALRTYCCGLGPLRVHSMRIHAWISSDGKHRQTFCSRVKYLVLLCLGADISLLSTPLDSDASGRSNSKAKKESLRVTMVHGDIVVLAGGNFEFSMVRTGMCMLLEAECI